MPVERTPLLCTVPTSGQGGLGGLKSRGGAPRGVRPALSGAWAGDPVLRACVIGPRTGADAPVAPVGAPPPQRGNWELCKPRRALCLAGRMMRGWFVGWAKRSVPTSLGRERRPMKERRVGDGAKMRLLPTLRLDAPGTALNPCLIRHYRDARNTPPEYRFLHRTLLSLHPVTLVQ